MGKRRRIREGEEREKERVERGERKKVTSNFPCWFFLWGIKLLEGFHDII